MTPASAADDMGARRIQSEFGLGCKSADYDGVGSSPTAASILAIGHGGGDGGGSEWIS